MDHFHILKDLKSGIYKPIYVLHGTEPFYIDQIDQFISENALDDSEREFNQTILYGLDTDVSAIVGEAKRFPMMAERQVVIVREAQRIRNLLGGEEKNELVQYLQNPQPTTVLVLCHKYKKIDSRRKTGKALLDLAKKHGVVLASEKMRDYKLPDWISGHVKQSGHTIDQRTAAIISQHLGNDLGRIHNELNKLYMDMPSNGQVTPDLVQERIGISKDYNVFEYQDALGKNDLQKATRIALHFGHNKNEYPLPMITTILYGYYSKLLKVHYHKRRGKGGADLASACGLNQYFLKDYLTAAANIPYPKAVNALSHLREADLHSKGYENPSTEHAEILKELNFKLMH